MVKKKGSSKRVTLKQKYKVEKKVREHKKKERKTARNALKGPQKKKKDPGIPNAWPFKEQVLLDIEEEKAALGREKDRQKELRMQAITDRRAKAMQDMVASAAERSANFQDVAVEADGSINGGGVRKDNSRRQYMRDLRKVISNSDVVLQVLDARDPQAYRCASVEAAVVAAGKRLVLVLNKVDLVPKAVVEKWLVHLRGHYPTIAFKASTQAKSMSGASGKATAAKASLLNSSCAVGGETLLQLLKNYARAHGAKLSITAGVVGYPNVGKSSVINSLKRLKAVGVSSTPGFTKCIQEVSLDSKIKLLDSPGVVFDDATTSPSSGAGSGSSSGAAVLLRNVMNVSSMSDPEPAVAAMLQRCSREHLMMLYNIATFSDPVQFLQLIAMKKGKLKKGGVADRKAAARAVLNDWNDGLIGYYTPAPTQRNTTVSAEIREGWAQELDLKQLEQAEAKALAGLPQQPAVETVELTQVEVEALQAGQELDLEAGSDEEDGMEEEGGSTSGAYEFAGPAGKKGRKSVKKAAAAASASSEAYDFGADYYEEEGDEEEESDDEADL